METLLEHQSVPCLYTPPIFKVGVRGKAFYTRGEVSVGAKLLVFVSNELNISISCAETTIKTSLEIWGNSTQFFPSKPYSADIAETKVARLNDFLSPLSKDKIEFFCCPV